MIAYPFQKYPPTWSQLVDTLESHLIGNPVLAKELEKKHCIGKLQRNLLYCDAAVIVEVCKDFNFMIGVVRMADGQ